MPTITQDQVLNALRAVKDPDLGRDIVALGFVKEVKICDGIVGITIELTTPACPVKDLMKNQAAQVVRAIPGVTQVNVTMTAQVRPTRSQQKDALIPKVKNIVPVASGKGGVGKSTVSANLALALSKLGAKVGLMDADVYGPSIPTIMGVNRPPRGEGNKIIPIEQYGIKIMSVGFFLKPGEAVIWRGPMLHKTIEQFLGTVDWGELDYLVVDLPPGTGDIQLSLCQIIPLTGAVVVSTPQDVALKVAEKAILMFDKLHTPILGLIENMSFFTCSNCGHREEIFSHGGAKKYCLEHNLPFLGEIPLSTDIRATADEGAPIVYSKPDHPMAQAYLTVAQNVAAQISVQAMGGSSGVLAPKQVTQPARNQIRIVWNDGHESLYPTRLVRINCACAQCVDENTGRRILNEASVPADVWAVGFSPVGRYALHFQWSDGHGSGIYTFENLRKFCPCPACTSAVPA